MINKLLNWHFFIDVFVGIIIGLLCNSFLSVDHYEYVNSQENDTNEVQFEVDRSFVLIELLEYCSIIYI